VTIFLACCLISVRFDLQNPSSKARQPFSEHGFRLAESNTSFLFGIQPDELGITGWLPVSLRGQVATNILD
jgi:hypothetical protein